jgi:hypothetical protein
MFASRDGCSCCYKLGFASDLVLKAYCWGNSSSVNYESDVNYETCDFDGLPVSRNRLNEI